ncbi:MAG: adenylate cyclase [Christensenellales bacterium]|jgi:hypothetical protein
MNSMIKNTNIRLNLEREDDRRAWAYLQKLDKKQYKSYSRAVVLAINDYFSRQERVLHDPYLETREKEDAFLQNVLDTIRQELHTSAPVYGLMQLLQGIQPAASAVHGQQESNESIDDALDFVNSF